MPHGRKTCPVVGCPEIISSRQRRCETHQAEYEQQRGTRQQRGYGAEHDAERAWWQRRIDRGVAVFCARGCGTRITGRHWDLGHTDDRAAWTGPECSRCNRRAGAMKANTRPR